MKRVLIAWLCAWQLAGPMAWGVGIPTGRPKLGLLRLGGTESPATERALSVLESRLRRWLEDLPSWEGEVRALPAPVRTEELAWETEAARLKSLAEALATVSEDEAVGLLDRVHEARERLEKVPRMLPAIQTALSCEAHYWWRRGARRRAAGLLKEAVGLHPDGALPTGSDSPRGAIGMRKVPIRSKGFPGRCCARRANCAGSAQFRSRRFRSRRP
jgi:hypothetical protein